MKDALDGCKKCPRFRSYNEGEVFEISCSLGDIKLLTGSRCNRNPNNAYINKIKEGKTKAELARMENNMRLR